MTDNNNDPNLDIVPEPLYRNGIDLSEPGALDYWCAEFGCQSAVLIEAVQQAGSNSVAAVSGAIRSILKRQQRRHELDDCSP